MLAKYSNVYSRAVIVFAVAVAVVATPSPAAVKPRLYTRQWPEATVITVWKMAVCKWGVSKRGILKCPVSHVLNC